jgi:hypothetical protein
VEKKVTFKDTLKSQDTEEWLDLIFYRPLGYVWALLFRKLGITPNTVTMLSIILGVASGVMFYFNSLTLNVIGMALLIWANSYDSADGQLARMTGKYSRLGRLLDGAAGDFWFISIYAAICLRLMPEWGLWIWALGAAAGYCHVKQSAMADYLRNFHLLFIKGKKGSEHDDSKRLAEEVRRLSWKNNFVEKFFLKSYISYTRDQERWTPRLQVLKQTMRERFGDDELPPEDFRTDFRQASLPMMKFTNILTFNTRSIVLFISLIVGMAWLYFVFELIVMNIILIYMLNYYGNICKRFDFRLRGND